MKKAARIVVENCLGIKPAEEVLIITDGQTRRIGEALSSAARDLGAEAVLVDMLEREAHGFEPPRVVAQAMKMADVVIAPTSKSLTHTKARREATESGARIASMPTITEEIMCRTMSADYTKIKEVSEKFCNVLSQGSEVWLTTPAGTDLVIHIAGRKALADTGYLCDKGAFGNLPAGEACLAPVEGTTCGIAMIDGTMAGIGLIKTPIKLEIKDGLVTKISGGQEAEALIKLFEGKGNEVKNVAELGIGTNEKAILSGSLLEDEKVLGTVHIGLGDNIAFGGSIKAPMHLDGIMLKPTLVVDGKTVIKDGKHLI